MCQIVKDRKMQEEFQRAAGKTESKRDGDEECAGENEILKQ